MYIYRWILSVCLTMVQYQATGSATSKGLSALDVHVHVQGAFGVQQLWIQVCNWEGTSSALGKAEKF